jgi:hypothetical protein
LVAWGGSPTGQGIGEVTAVADLAHEVSVVLPQVYLALAACVEQAVAGEFGRD